MSHGQRRTKIVHLWNDEIPRFDLTLPFLFFRVTRWTGNRSMFLFLSGMKLTGPAPSRRQTLTSGSSTTTCFPSAKLTWGAGTLTRLSRSSTITDKKRSFRRAWRFIWSATARVLLKFLPCAREQTLKSRTRWLGWWLVWFLLWSVNLILFPTCVVTFIWSLIFISLERPETLDQWKSRNAFSYKMKFKKVFIGPSSHRL